MNLKKFGKNRVFRNIEKTCLELYEVYWDASSHKMQPRCTSILAEPITSVMRAALKMEAVGSPETLVPLYQTAW
jgi:hypothetical protein